MTRRGADVAAGPEPAQQTQPHEHGQAVPGGGEVGEVHRRELAGGQHPVLGHQADQSTVTVGEMT